MSLAFCARGWALYEKQAVRILGLVGKLRASKSAGNNHLLDVPEFFTDQRAASFIAVAFATRSACVSFLAALKDGTPSVDMARRCVFKLSTATWLLTTDRAGRFIAVAFVTLSSSVSLLAALEVGSVGASTVYPELL